MNDDSMNNMNGMNDQNQSSSSDSYVDSYVPPADDMPQSGRSVVSQQLEDQNIFFLLGVEDGTDEEKEQFLDDLQRVIWEDFLESDVELLLTEEELDELKKIAQDKNLSDDELQEKTVVYLEKLVPDLEEIMLEKALELKEDMVRERAAGMKEYFMGNDESKIDVISAAEDLMNDGQWRDAAEKLNSLRPRE